MEDEGKDLFLSKSTWGAIILAIAPILARYGISLDIDATVNGLVALAGLALFVWGQLTRKKRITSVAGISVKPSEEKQP